jgi:Tfp pilus assembly PilM family ATPase
MANTIILEWDPARVRAAVGSASSTAPSVQRTVTFDLSSGEESDEVVTMADSIAAGLKEHKIGKGDAIVVVERSVAELRVLSVPPVPDDELPDVVRFQAGREFTSVSEGWLVDFIRLPSAPNGQRRVLAGAISPQVAAQIRGTCDTAGLNLKKVVLRPFASGRLLAAAGMLQEDCVLIELLGDSADMTVFSQGELQLTRSIRVSSEASVEAVTKQMQLELKRTLTSFQNQQQDADVKRVLIMASSDLSSSLESTLSEALELQCLAVDPWSIFKNLGSAKGSAPEHAETLAAVLGGLCSASDAYPEIDFVNPTRPPAPPSHRRRNVLIAATAATLLVSLGGLYWVQASQLDAKLAQLQDEVAKMGREDQTYQDRLKEIGMLEEWVNNRPNWLAEMGEMSRQFPLPDDAIVDNLGLSLDEKNHLAVIKLTGKASSAEAIRQLEQELRDPDTGREVSGRQNSPTASGPYKFRFDETLTVDLAHQSQDETGKSAELTPQELITQETTGEEEADEQPKLEAIPSGPEDAASSSEEEVSEEADPEASEKAEQESEEATTDENDDDDASSSANQDETEKRDNTEDEIENESDVVEVEVTEESGSKESGEKTAEGEDDVR